MLPFFRHCLYFFLFIVEWVIKMKVKVFDENHEKDLEKSVNDFLEELEGDVIDIKFQVSTAVFSEEQIYCFSAMIIYHS